MLKVFILSLIVAKYNIIKKIIINNKDKYNLALCDKNIRNLQNYNERMNWNWFGVNTVAIQIYGYRCIMLTNKTVNLIPLVKCMYVTNRPFDLFTSIIFFSRLSNLTNTSNTYIYYVLRIRHVKLFKSENS